MKFVMRAFLVVTVALSAASVARAEDGDTAQNRAKLEDGRRAIASMRESYAYVMRKEEQAKSDHDPVLLNTLHQITARIADLVNVADHALDDMRVAISSNEPPEAIDAELEKIMLAKTKVEQARAEADRSAGIKLLTGDGSDSTSRNFLSESENMTNGQGNDAFGNLQQGGMNGLPPAGGGTSNGGPTASRTTE